MDAQGDASADRNDAGAIWSADSVGVSLTYTTLLSAEAWRYETNALTPDQTRLLGARRVSPPGPLAACDNEPRVTVTVRDAGGAARDYFATWQGCSTVPVITPWETFQTFLDTLPAACKVTLRPYQAGHAPVPVEPSPCQPGLVAYSPATFRATVHGAAGTRLSPSVAPCDRSTSLELPSRPSRRRRHRPPAVPRSCMPSTPRATPSCRWRPVGPLSWGPPPPI